MLPALRWNAPTFFLLAALLLNGIYLAYFSPLFQYYPHGAQRFFHVVHLAEKLRGNPDSLPVSFLELLSKTGPSRLSNVSAIPCGKWEKELLQTYCRSSAVEKYEQSAPLPVSQLLDIPLNPDQRFAFVSHIKAAHFPAVGYLPYVIGALPALMLNLPPAMVMYAAVLANAAVMIALGYATLRLLPILRWPLCALLLVPTVSMYYVFVMPDVLSIELCFFAFAVSLYLKHTRARLRRRDLAGLFVLALLIALIKVVYLPVVLVFFLIPPACFGGTVAKWRTLAAIVLCAAVATGLWGMYALKNYYPQTQNEQVRAEEGDLNFAAKKQFIMDHPLTHVAKAYSTLTSAKVLSFKINNLFTWKFCWLSSPWQMALLLLALLLPAVLARGMQEIPLRLSLFERVACLAIAAAGLLMLYTVMFLHEEVYVKPIGLSWMLTQNYVQGRYLIPLVPFVLLAVVALCPIRERWRKAVKPLLLTFLIGCLVYLHYSQLAFSQHPSTLCSPNGIRAL